MLILNALLARLIAMDAYRQSVLSVVSLDDTALKAMGFKGKDITKISRCISFGG